MSTHVHRAGAHRIVVQDETGREVTLVSQDHTLEITTSGAGPRLTPQMAHDLADELHQWATCQQTVRSQGHRRAGGGGRRRGHDRSGAVDRLRTAFRGLRASTAAP